MEIRLEEPLDVDGVRAVNLAAFKTDTEADLVDALRKHAQPLVSLVAEDNGAIVGHILFSPAVLDMDHDLRVMGLAPMAVTPARQRHGIGSALVRRGLTHCEQLEVDAVIVLGHADYYSRFGFTPASRLGITSEYDVPDNVFMLLACHPARLSGKSGLVRYHPIFKSVLKGV